MMSRQKRQDKKGTEVAVQLKAPRLKFLHSRLQLVLFSMKWNFFVMTKDLRHLN